jgi:hypothetical protein
MVRLRLKNFLDVGSGTLAVQVSLNGRFTSGKSRSTQYSGRQVLAGSESRRETLGGPMMMAAYTPSFARALLSMWCLGVMCLRVSIFFRVSRWG